MKVSISVPGRFHLFNLAQELERHHALERLITSHPRFKVLQFGGIPREKIVSIVVKELLERGFRKMPLVLKSLYNPQFMIHEVFDRLAAKRIGNPDIVVGGSSVFLHTLRAAAARGIATVVEHGSSHILYQDEILKEEYEAYGVPMLPYLRPHPRIVEKELAEYEEADAIAIPSLYVKRTFLERGIPEKKIIHVPYGVDLAAFRKVQKTDDVFRVIFVGGMTLRKGVHYLLQAFSELKLKNAELLLVGTMNEEMAPFFKKYEGVFRYAGHVPQKELYKQYSNASVFVLASIEEGLAMVQPQAMACGLPVIATTNTGGEDIIRDGVDGFIIPIRSVEALKEKILWMYEHPEERTRMGESAMVRVQSGFTWQDYGNRMVQAYERLLQ
jgi:glycosyltransferase involved in cell wall biosynthesis